MVQTSTLEIHGYHQADVPNTFWRQPGDAQHLAIVLPGLGYTADMPLLYYPARLLVTQGADLLQVQYDYPKNPQYLSLDASGQAAWLYADAYAACFTALRQRSYQRITLIGKSLGTMAMAHLLGDKPEFTVAECLWLTPVLNDSLTLERLRTGVEKGLVVIGTHDHYYSEEQVMALRQRPNLQVDLYERADHSLEIAGDIPGSLRLMERFVDKIGQFLFS